MPAIRDAVIHEQIDHNVPRLFGAEADYLADGYAAFRIAAYAVGRTFAVAPFVRDEALGTDILHVVLRGLCQGRKLLQFRQRLGGSECTDGFAHSGGAFPGLKSCSLRHPEDFPLVEGEPLFEV